MPQEDSNKYKSMECRKCYIKLNDENKVTNQKLCRNCNSIICKEYKQKNKEAISIYNKKYKAEHKTEIDKYNHDYNKLNRTTIQKRHTVYLREKRKNDINYKISIACRNRIKKLVKGTHKTSTLIDCSKDILMEWLKSNFTSEMTFENHGSYWHIDHVIPCKHFDLTNEKQLKMCFHWSNLQPLKASTNLSKKDTLNKEEINNHWLKVNDFIKSKNMNITYTLLDYESCITTLTM